MVGAVWPKKGSDNHQLADNNQNGCMALRYIQYNSSAASVIKRGKVKAGGTRLVKLQRFRRDSCRLFFLSSDW